MQLLEFAEIARARAEAGKDYLQFINEGTLSLGLYVLAAGAEDKQTPHAEDEIYYVVSGQATVEVAGERQAVKPGSIVYVAREVPHRFLDIEEDLSLLVFFAPEHQVS